MFSLSGSLNIVILLGAIQGFIISSLLLAARQSRTANRLLAALIFLISLACLNLYLNSQQWFATEQFFRFFSAVMPMVIIMPVGPLLFFYTKASLDPAFKLSKKNRLHFLPVIIDLFPYLTAIIFIAAALSGLLKHVNFDVGLFIDTYNVYSDIPRWVSLTIYVVLSIRYIAAYKKQADAHKMAYQLKWAKRFTAVFLAFQVLWLLYLIPYVMPVYSDKLMAWVNWYPLYVPLSILIYWLGINGYLVMQHQPPVAKKQGALLPADTSEQTVMLLKKAMEQDALYLNPELSLNIIAQHTGIPQKTISAVLNQYLHKSFNEFVNEYRVNAFKKKLCSDHIKHLTIAGIAAECGFNSQATFQRTFRQITGLSPSEFKLQALHDN
jgi:AraC-like DNA-binding protein